MYSRRKQPRNSELTERDQLRKRDQRCVELDCLYDTGSPISFIKEKDVPRSVRDDRRPAKAFRGINRSKLEVLAVVDARIMVVDDEINVRLHVVPNETMAVTVVLGRDFLCSSNFKLVRKLPEPLIEVEPNILNIDVQVDDNSQQLEIKNDLPHEIKAKVLDMFQNKYITPERPAEPKTVGCLELTLTNKNPFYSRPRRLSFDEKKKLKDILDDWLHRGIIRESESEYASPIVLVKKKDGKLRVSTIER